MASGTPQSSLLRGLSTQRPLLITGAAGFIGARCVESFAALGIPLISVDASAHFQTRMEHRGLPFGTIIDRERLFEALKMSSSQEGFAPPGAVLHLGACSDTTQLNVEYLQRVNVEYSQKLWDYCTEAKIPFVYASSAATYGEGEQGYADEESRMRTLKPLNPYGQSKLDFDLWVLEQEKAGRTPPYWSGFKFFNVYGFGERHKGKMASVVLHAFDQIRSKGTVRLFKSHRQGIADGEQKRDFVSVEDVVSVLEFALDTPLRRGIFNLGTGQARTFLDLVRSTFRALGRPESIEFIDTPVALRERYQYWTQAEMNKLKQAGYTKPFLPLEEGVARYVARLSKASAEMKP